MLRWSALRERLRSSLWFWPSVAVAIALLVGLVLPRVEAGRDVVTFGFAGTPEGARAVLATVAGSLITVTSLTFSLTVVALQVASSQFTPRLMGTFLSDRGNQAVLSVFLGTFTYTLAVLPSVRSEDESRGAFVPNVSLSLGLVLTLLSVAMLVYFIHHLTQQLRVETVLAEVEHETLERIRSNLPEIDRLAGERATPEVPDEAVAIVARRAGYLQTVSMGTLHRTAVERGLVLRLRPVVGTHVTAGTTLAWVWRLDGGAVPDLDDVARAVHGGIHLGTERTLQQDVAFGIRQLVDIAARSLSPGINDPTTAVAALGSISTVLAELLGRDLDARVELDDDGRVRAVVDQPSFGELLALACDQPRRYGRTEPAVLTEVLRLLTDLAEIADDPGRCEVIRLQVAATVREAEDAGLPDDVLDRVRSSARQATATLERGARVPTIPNEIEEPAS